jgi:hypothetical protein
MDGIIRGRSDHQLWLCQRLSKTVELPDHFRVLQNVSPPFFAEAHRSPPLKSVRVTVSGLCNYLHPSLVHLRLCTGTPTVIWRLLSTVKHLTLFSFLHGFTKNSVIARYHIWMPCSGYQRRNRLQQSSHRNALPPQRVGHEVNEVQQEALALLGDSGKMILGDHDPHPSAPVALRSWTHRAIVLEPMPFPLAADETSRTHSVCQVHLGPYRRGAGGQQVDIRLSLSYERSTHRGAFGGNRPRAARLPG